MGEYKTDRVLAGRIRMHILDWPHNGDDPPVLFVHGITGSGMAGLRLGNLLAGRRRVISPDLRGHGWSDMPFSEYGVAAHAKDLILCMDRLGIQRFVVTGHSLGGIIGLYIAAQYPDRVTGLIMFDSGAVAPDSAWRLLVSYYEGTRYHYNSLDEYVSRFKNSPLYQPWTEELEALVLSNLFRQPDGTYTRQIPRYVLETDLHSLTPESREKLAELYPKIECPVLIFRASMGLFGPGSMVLPDESLSALLHAIPSAQAITIEEASHTSLLTIPCEARDRAIVKFLGLET